MDARDRFGVGAMRRRAREIGGQLGEGSFDLIVVGAGVNGAGIARDAARRGLRVLLLDKGDVASGTTSWSSRLIHGGLRYLEHGEVGLVRESLRERERLLQGASHLVRPLPLLIPIYQGDRRGPLTVRAGMVAYDVLSFDKSLDRHRMLSREEALARAPGLAPEGLRGAAVYYDAQVEYAERLAVENALDARDHGAVVLLHARVDRLLLGEGDTEGATVRGVTFTDLLDGGTHEALAPVTINVAGPWVDQVLTGGTAAAGGGGATSLARMIGGTKGSHIVVDPFPGAPVDALYVEARRDGRPYFIIPWNGQYLIGTTDVRYEGDLDRVVASEEEIAYLLEETNRVIPTADLTRESVRYTYSGVRPLPYQAEGAEGAITRRHIVHDHAPSHRGLLSIVGGKLTTYRNLAEQAVDAAVPKLGRAVPPSDTARVPLPGARAADGAAGDRDATRERLTEAAAGLGLLAETIDHLARTYGARAQAIVALAAAEPDLGVAIAPETGAIAAEVVLAIREELAETLGDVLLRRTMVGLGREVGIGADERAADVAVRHLGWDAARAAEEVAAYRVFVERYNPQSLRQAPAQVV